MPSNITLVSDKDIVGYRSFTFPGGEIQIRLDNDTEIPQQLKIVAFIKDTDGIIQLLMITDALRQKRLDVELSLSIPYLPYARQDRVCSPGEAFGLKVMCDLINAQNYKTVTVWDVHSPVSIRGVARIVNIPAARFLNADLIGGSVLVSPDKGAIDRVAICADTFNRPMIVAEKIRDPLTGNITGTKICDEDMERINNGEISTDGGFLMVDDICDGGRTFIELAKVLRPMTTGRTRLYVTHGIFSQGFEVFEGLVDEILTPNCFQEAVPSFVTTI